MTFLLLAVPKNKELLKYQKLFSFSSAENTLNELFVLLDMAAKIFSPFIARLRRRVDEGLLPGIELQNEVSEIPVDVNGFIKQSEDSSEAASGTSNANTVITRKGNEYTLPMACKGEIEDHVDTTASRTSKFAFVGITLAIVCSLLFSVASLMVKLAESIPSLEVAFMRLTFQLVFSIPPMIFFNDKVIHPWKKTRFLVLRAVAGTTTMNLGIYAVKHMPLADARVIMYTSPVYTAILGRIFLKESVTKFDLIATLLSLGGVVLIGRPTFLFGSLGKSSKQVWFPTLLAVIGAFCAACAIVLTRKVSQQVPARVVVFYSALIGSIISLSASLISGGFKYPDCGTHDAVYIIVAGVLGYSAQLTVTKALSLEKASIVSLVRTVGIVFSFLLQLTVLGVAPNWLSIGGAFLVLLCNVTIFIKKVLDQKKK